jgi:RNA-directed DNA polymerase
VSHGTDEAGEPTQRDPVEGRGHRDMDLLEGKMDGTPSPEYISTGVQRIAELARQAPGMAFTTLAHHIDIELLTNAFKRTRRDAAAGIDGQTADEYAVDLEANLRQLEGSFKTGRYKAPPVRRVHIPKGDGRTRRPIGIPTIEDKVLQRAVTMVLEPIYEQDFLPCSYGFRPGKSAHQALQALWEGLMTMGGGWVLEVDIKSFFDTLDHGHLRSFLDRRVRDGVIRRMIDKWLKAGVLEEGSITYPESGTPQGGVISPLLANIYLHEVLDMWFEREVKPRLRGAAFLIRFADDFAIGFSLESDARRVFEVLPKRFERYGLQLHPEKTRLVPFGRPRGGTRPGTFDLLGFTHYWKLSRKGNWVIARKTAKGRLARALHRITQWCKTNRHVPVKDQHKALVRKLTGHFAYYGITGNYLSLNRLRTGVIRAWHTWLQRRSQKARLTWDRYNRLLKRYPLPSARVVHSIYRHAANP